ncbi:GNAT family N-acetyltransferase [Streptomyces sp. PKU-EA00015]|uniref:GNAT family N-acetyltransferase n=1 Tax=Streptomyces sp. PKU-EA00015 TaxID=2748326 RepID=UPI0015A2B7DF|nr:GNAT family N-acetyltransferase [Streptomyces sp. PKU-EA00015]NWF29160.1 GNAT family N-acetyltransferase [Streptomyces sp. PKU-EA00015]
MQTSSEHAYPDHWEADVVLRDGGTARIRPITTEDADRLVSFYEQVSDESKYYRFFAPYPRLSDKDVHRFTHHDYVDRVGLAMTVGGEFVATVRYDRINAQGRPASAPADEAEVAFLVQDAHQGRGIASALLEHIAAVARERGIRRFAAEVLPANNKMIKVFRDAGYTQKRSFEDGSVHLTLELEPTEESLAVQRGREQRAEARSVQRLLAPGSIAVIGVGRRPGGVGRTTLRNLLGAGFTGRVYAVNRAFPEGRSEVEGVPAVRSVGEAGEPVDLAIVAVPAERVTEVVADCGEHGVQGLVVLSAGYAESGAAGRERQRELVRQARSYGMRIIGPNAFGIINTADTVRLNASLAPESPAPGRIGLFTQSGAIGIALLSGLHRRGAGLSSFISSGNRADVSGNDFLQYWYEDPGTDVALLYLESLGNPRKFTRLARRTAAVKPVVVVKGARHSGSAPPGHAVPVTRMPDATVGALMRQAGVIRVDTVTELIDAGLLLAGQPLPAGPRVAILGNSESLGLLAYDACLTEGLRPLPPLDLTTEATPADFRTALARALEDEACDAVVVTAIPWVGENGVTESGDGEVLAAALRDAAATSPAKPVAVVHVEMGALADALSAASSTAPRARAYAPPPSAAAETGAGGPTVRADRRVEDASVPDDRQPDPGAASAAAAAGGPGGQQARSVESTPGDEGDEGASQSAEAGTTGAGGGSVPASEQRRAGVSVPVDADGDGGASPSEGGRAADERSRSGGSRSWFGLRGRVSGRPSGSSGPGSADAHASPGEPGTRSADAPHGSGSRPAGGQGAPAPSDTPSRAPGPGSHPADAAAGGTAPGTRGPAADPAGPPAPAAHGPAGTSAPGDDTRRIPAYPAAERAVRALAEAVRYAQWRRQAAEPGRVPEYDDIDETGAAAQIERLLGDDSDARGFTLGQADTHELLARYGIPVRPALPASDTDSAVEAARRLGYPVALKTTAPHLRHRADLGGVRLDLADETQLRQAYEELTGSLGKPAELQPVVQAMVPRGVDTVVRAAIDPAAGAVLSFGLAGPPSELLGDTAHRLVPATDRDAAELVRSIRTAPLLFGWRGSAPVDTAALEELLLRVSRLVDDHPEVVSIGLEPVVVAPQGLSVLDASVRLAPPPPRTDLGPRRLPSY